MTIVFVINLFVMSILLGFSVSLFLISKRTVCLLGKIIEDKLSEFAYFKRARYFQNREFSETRQTSYFGIRLKRQISYQQTYYLGKKVGEPVILSDCKEVEPVEFLSTIAQNGLRFYLGKYFGF